MKDVKLEIIKDYGTLSEHNGFSKKLIKAKWNNGSEKIEIRNFAPDGRPLKGIGLDDGEVKELNKLLSYI